jgi:hypothetical protein
MIPGAALCAAAFALLTVAMPARAQMPPEIADLSPAQLATGSFSTEYGKLLIAEFARVVQASADPECLRTKRIDDGALRELVTEVVVRNGTRFLEIGRGLVNTAKFEETFEMAAGKEAKAEYKRLRELPQVKGHIELSNPARYARIADAVIETMNRNAVVSGYKLSELFSPRSSGNAALLQANPSEKAAAAARAYMREHDSAELRRWDHLTRSAVYAQGQATDMQELLRLGPTQLTPDLGADLERLCVSRN